LVSPFRVRVGRLVEGRLVDAPPRTAAGRLIRSNSANAWAHHMLPTTVVIMIATFVLNRLTAESRREHIGDCKKELGP
jgi:hypothetical protein